jgi:hypothetical protein
MGSLRPRNSTRAERARFYRSVYRPSPPIARRPRPLVVALLGHASAWEGRQ